ncbi:Uncharacterised protein [BD1-7 clade bacterium]|uniref:EcsC protein family protein n=1 Tax=BD1-7 clade bacterium TaxID=2029982 RepID=A0A5S9PRF0_9GAMM|nr:Uncharacterised protein [BD1-7 clade bacterium]
MNMLPDKLTDQVNRSVETALHKSAGAALYSLGNHTGKNASPRLHKLMAASSGAVGGAFGFSALFVELPVSTTIMMRAVADIARSEGFDLSDVSTKAACIEVFALGGKAENDESTEIGYYLVRGMTAETMRQLSKELGEIAAKQGVKSLSSIPATQSGKWLAALINKVAAQFGFVITKKMAAQMVPVIGAFSGATLNTLFTNYYQSMARGHFIVRRLERTYGFEQIRSAYSDIVVAGASV